MTERTSYILRVRQLAVGIAHAYIDEATPKTLSTGMLNAATGPLSP